MSDQIVTRSVEEVMRDARTRTSAALCVRDIREIGSRTGPYSAARTYGRCRQRFAGTKADRILLADLIGGAALELNHDNAFIGHNSARREIGRELMDPGEEFAHCRDVRGLFAAYRINFGDRQLHRAVTCSIRERYTPWFKTKADARRWWKNKAPGSGAKLRYECADFEGPQIIAIKRDAALIEEYVIDPSVKPSLRWEVACHA